MTPPPPPPPPPPPAHPPDPTASSAEPGGRSRQASELRARSPGASRQPVPRGPAPDRQPRGSRRPRPGDDAQGLPRLAPVRAGDERQGVVTYDSAARLH